MALTFTHKDLEFGIGDTVKVNYKIREKDKERVQAFDGVILAIKGQGDSKTFLVAKNATDGIRVERIFPISSPWIDSIKKIRSPKTKIRRAKLYFLRKPHARAI
ncbi:50S ribosomal protein L19 [Candidatus Shapirobacteria bacterium CG06_land_8_20_14_3_00_40_12]|uniref:50S ribosomal protein L19 n=2 Tax=Candidatus Shapironibacteriota TaxID=1752721 RepID=A0A2M7TTJ1_9BACT|nr:MAG: 50S ribosomal protein L19 [Candidatus Shapirobacteria bacterium CG06_land_8_20_14_3_00_40_12]PIZ59681.1 MAG: 50S ribosomal protein L19 [Candidatus Shapirobacteria bacterium CG_4_10_14_0_2_um_filter_40_12]